MPVASWAVEYLSIPYAPMGRSRAGVDCWGLVAVLYRERFRIDLPSYAEQYASPSDREEVARLIASQRPLWRAVEAGAERVGDVVVLRCPGEAVAAHVGVVVGEGMMLDARVGGVVCEPYRTGLWADRVDGFVRHERR